MNQGKASRASLAVAVGLTLALQTTTSVRAQTQADYGGYRPHFQGYGVNTPGGRRGTVIKVTNLNDSGAGSLRTALTPASCTPRIVVFEISGTIALASPVVVTCPFLTVAGQTAPNPGILIRNYALYFDTHDVVLQHLRLRLGDEANPTGSEDVISIRNNAYNIVLDHLSLSWGTHGLLGVNAWSGAQAHDVASLDCIFAEGLGRPGSTTATNVPYGTGTLFMPSGDGTITLARNLWAHNGNRNPWISAGNRASGYNNVAYNPKGFAGDPSTSGFAQFLANQDTTANERAWIYEIVWIGNVAIPGPDTHPDTHPIKVDLTAAEAAAGYQLYLADNIGPYMTSTDQWSGVTFQNGASEAAVKITTIPSWHAAFNYEVLPGKMTQSSVLSHAGARPLDRDSVDNQVVRDVTNLTGHAISSQTEVGGFPVLAVNTRPYTIPANANVVAPGQTFRTNIEMNLEAMARALELPRTQAGVPPAPANVHLFN